MSMQPVVVEVIRALRWDGEVVRPGQTIRLAPAAAAEVLASGRGRLVHADDAVLCLAATRDSIRAALKAERASWQPPQVDGPWRLVDQRPFS